MGMGGTGDLERLFRNDWERRREDFLLTCLDSLTSYSPLSSSVEMGTTKSSTCPSYSAAVALLRDCSFGLLLGLLRSDCERIGPPDG